jgi:hypothetical protein
MDSPFWIFLDQTGIVIGLIFAFVEVAQLVYLWHISEDVEDIQEDVEDIEKDLENDGK